MPSDSIYEQELGTLQWEQEPRYKKYEGYVWFYSIVLAVMGIPFANQMAELLYILFS